MDPDEAQRQVVYGTSRTIQNFKPDQIGKKAKFTLKNPSLNLKCTIEHIVHHVCNSKIVQFVVRSYGYTAAEDKMEP